MRTRVIVPAVLAAVCLGAGGGCSSQDVRRAAAAADGPVYRPEIQPLGWSADGRRVRFVHTELYGGYDHADFRCGGSGVYETDGGSPPRAVTAGQPWCQHAAGWLIRFSSSADGRTVYQLRDSGFGDCSAIQAFDLPGARWRQAARLCGSHVFAPAISPDGRRIAVGLGCGQSYGGGEPPHITPRGCVDRDGDRITVMNVDGSGPRIVGEPRDRHPVWSPDGRSLAVMTEGEWNIAVIDLETGARRVVTQGEHPAWSPDGQWLAFTRFAKNPEGRVTLRVIRTDGTREHTVFRQDRKDMRSGPQYPSPGGWPRHPLWSPDGRQVVFTKHFQSGNTLWIVNADGTGLRRLSERIEPAG
jgi:Tol biopolymer transport system component